MDKYIKSSVVTDALCKAAGWDAETIELVDGLPGADVEPVVRDVERSNQRLIDADALYRRIKTECNPYGKPTIIFDDGRKVLDIIKNAPTVPAVVLPCTVGDTVWDTLYEQSFTVTIIELYPGNKIIIRCGNVGTNDYVVYSNDQFGSRVLFGEEAEAALRRANR